MSKSKVFNPISCDIDTSSCQAQPSSLKLNLKLTFAVFQKFKSCGAGAGGGLVWDGFTKTTMASLNQSCIEFELGLGYDNDNIYATKSAGKWWILCVDCVLEDIIFITIYLHYPPIITL